MKKLLIALGVLAMLGTKAQISFLEASQHTISPNSMGVVNGFQWNDTTYLALYDAYYGLGTRTMHIIEYDEFGKRRKEITPNYHYGGAIPKKLSKIGDSKIYLIGSGDDSLGRFTTFNYMYDSNWNVLWSKGYSFRYGEISVLNDSVGIASVQIRNYRTGIAAINLNTGDTLWTKSNNQAIGVPDSVVSGLSFANLTLGSDYIYSLFQKSNSNLNIVSVLRPNGSFVRNDTVLSGVFDQRIFYVDSGYIFYDNSVLDRTSSVVNIRNGSALWKINVKTNSNVSIIPISKKNEFFYLLIQELGTTNFSATNCRLLKLNTKGETVITNKYLDKDFVFGFSSISCTKDGGFFGTCGTTRNIDSHYILKLDSNGFVSNPTLFPLVVDTSLSVLSENIEKHDSQIKIYPNPASHHLTIELGSSQTAHYSLQILNGQEVQSGSFKQTTNLDISKQPNGIYFLHLQGQGIIETRKIVVQH